MKKLSLFFCLIPTWLMALQVDESALDQCLDIPARLDRLFCYDRLFGVEPTAAQEEAIATDGPKTAAKPQAHQQFHRLMSSKYRTESGVSISFWNAKDNRAIDDELDYAAYLEAGWSSETANQFVYDTSIFVAIPANQTLGEDGGLVASCENNISHLRFFWDTPVEGRLIEASLLFGDDISVDVGVERLRMRITDEGYVTNAPRGLEAISILKNIGEGPRGQVSIGERETLRSLFFDTEPLAEALPIIAKHCGWTFLQEVEK